MTPVEPGMRGERWLLRLGEFMVRAATARLPKRVRNDRYREWTAELPVILNDPDGGKWPQRVGRMLGYALDTNRGTIVGAQSAHHHGVHRGRPDNSWLGPFGVLVGLLVLPFFIYFSVTADGGLGFCTIILVTSSLNLIGYIRARRRGKYALWPGPGFWWAAGAWTAAAGQLALIAAKHARWRGGLLRVITLAGTVTAVACVVLLGIGVLAAVRLAIRRRAQRRAGMTGGPAA